MRDGFIFYASFYEAISELEPEQQLECYTAISEYALFGREVETTGVVKAIFSLIKPQINANNQRYENGKKGGRPKVDKNNQDETKVKPKQNQDETKAEPKEKVKEKEKEKVKDKEKERRIIPPSLSLVQQYISEQGYVVDAESFIDYYTARDWIMTNGKKMKDWQAAVRTWQRRGLKHDKRTRDTGAAGNDFDYNEAARRKTERFLERGGFVSAENS